MKDRVVIVLLGLLVFAHFGVAQSVDKPLPVSEFIAIIVEDIDRSIGWYEEKLGFSLENKNEMVEMGIKQTNMSLGRFRLELIERSSDTNSSSTNKARASQPGFFKVGFSIAEFDQWISYLRSVNTNFHGNIVTDIGSGRKMAIILDPDGNRIQLFEQ